jgi:hypothetical protein
MIDLSLQSGDAVFFVSLPLAAIAAGGELGGLLDALRVRDERQKALEAGHAALRAQRQLKASEAARVRDELLTIAHEWRRVLAYDVPNARPIVTTLLKGRVTFEPQATPKAWTARGEGTLIGLFTRPVFPLVVRPQRERMHFPAGDRSFWRGRRSPAISL